MTIDAAEDEPEAQHDQGERGQKRVRDGVAAPDHRLGQALGPRGCHEVLVLDLEQR